MHRQLFCACCNDGGMRRQQRYTIKDRYLEMNRDKETDLQNIDSDTNRKRDMQTSRETDSEKG